MEKAANHKEDSCGPAPGGAAGNVAVFSAGTKKRKGMGDTRRAGAWENLKWKFRNWGTMVGERPDQKGSRRRGVGSKFQLCGGHTAGGGGGLGFRRLRAVGGASPSKTQTRADGKGKCIEITAGEGTGRVGQEWFGSVGWPLGGRCTFGQRPEGSQGASPGQ